MYLLRYLIKKIFFSFDDPKYTCLFKSGEVKQLTFSM